MPIMRVHALPQKPGIDPAEVMKRACRGLADHLELPAERVWATWDTIPGNHYVEGGKAAVDQPPGTHPPMVRVQAFEGRSPEEIEQILAVTAKLIAEGLGTEPDNVFVFYEELVSGRVYAGGKILRRT